MRAAAYARQSNEDRQRRGKSVGDQLAEARAEVERRGWSLVAELADEGISASRHSRAKQRPGFDALVDMVGRRQVGAVVCAEQSRLSRRLSEIGDLLELCADHRILLVTGGREVDLDDPMSWMMAGMQAGHDASSSEDTRRRVLRGKRHAALVGRPAGRPTLGYTRIYDPQTGAYVRTVVNEEEATVIREAAQRLLSGRSLRSTTLAVRDRLGRPQMADNGLKQLLLNPTICGHRVHQGQVVVREVWPPIITDEQQRAIREIFEGRRTGERVAARRHLLAGLATCWACGCRLVGNFQPTRSGGRRRIYRCMTHGCLKTVVSADPLDEFVAEAVLARLGAPGTVERFTDAWRPDPGRDAARAELAVLRERLDEIAEQVAAGALSARMGGAAEARVAERIDALEASLRPANSLPPALAALLAGDVRQSWEGLSLEQRIQIVRAVCTVEIGPATSRRPGLEIGRVCITWL